MKSYEWIDKCETMFLLIKQYMVPHSMLSSLQAREVLCMYLVTS